MHITHLLLTCFFALPANQDVRDLAARIGKHSTSEFEAVVPAFLEFAQPDIGAGVDYCVKLGACPRIGVYCGKDILAHFSAIFLKYE